MNKTEQRRLRIKTALSVLIKKFNAYDIDSGGGARFDFSVDYKDLTFHGQLDRRDLQVTFHESIRLHGDGWSAEEILKQKLAVELEDIINRELEDAVAELGF
jgi:hypothetical protein